MSVNRLENTKSCIILQCKIKMGRQLLFLSDDWFIKTDFMHRVQIHLLTDNTGTYGEYFSNDISLKPDDLVLRKPEKESWLATL